MLYKVNLHIISIFSQGRHINLLITQMHTFMTFTVAFMVYICLGINVDRVDKQIIIFCIVLEILFLIK